MKFGKIETVDIRELWKNEALDFTKWLAEPENIALLTEELGLGEFSEITTEKKIGNFSADILAKIEDDQNSQTVIIENQLEITNHDHLGKIITYGSGVEASILIWIFKEIRDEHRKAIDWLNEKTGSELQIFAVKIEAWKIGDSLPAPKFDVICSPNNWANIVKQTQNKTELTNTKLNQLEFWTNFSQYINNMSTKVNARKPQPQHWYDLSIGTSKLIISCIVSFKDNNIRCDLYIPNNKELFFALRNKKEIIEKELGFELVWEELENKNASRIRYQNNNVELSNKDNYENYYKWYIQIAEKYLKVIPKYVK